MQAQAETQTGGPAIPPGVRGLCARRHMRLVRDQVGAGAGVRQGSNAHVDLHPAREEGPSTRSCKGIKAEFQCIQTSLGNECKLFLFSSVKPDWDELCPCRRCEDSARKGSLYSETHDPWSTRTAGAAAATRRRLPCPRVLEQVCQAAARDKNRRQRARHVK